LIEYDYATIQLYFGAFFRGAKLQVFVPPFFLWLSRSTCTSTCASTKFPNYHSL